MPSSLPLISLAAAKANLPIRDGNTSFDVKLTSYVQVATQQIEGHSGRLFTYSPRTQLFDTAHTITGGIDLYGGGCNDSGVWIGARRQRFVLKAVPIDLTQPFRLWYDPSRQFSDPTCIIDPSQYTVNTSTGEVWAEIGTFSHMSAVAIDYTGGYPADQNGPFLDATQVDPRIQLACSVQTMYMFSKLHPDNVGFDSERTKGASSRPSYVQKFLTPSGLTQEAAGFLQWLKPLSIGRN